MTNVFAKIFSQIFDSSIAEDYNCRRMFMDLLILADATGGVDMTHEAISRRTNVPIEEVRRYIEELQRPDPPSRSKLEQGRRLIPLDSHRDWGWQIVNYGHYRKIRDEEVRRSYFRDAKRKVRSKSKKVNKLNNGVQDMMVDKGGQCGQVLTPSSTSTSSSKSACTQKEAEDFCESISLPRSDGTACFNKWEGNGWTNGGQRIRDWKATIRSWKVQNYLPSLKGGSNGQFERKMSSFEIEKRIGAITDEMNTLWRANGGKTSPEYERLKQRKLELKHELVT